MKLFAILLGTTTILGALAHELIPNGASILEPSLSATEQRSSFHTTDKWGHKPEAHRRIVRIRASRNGTDDISDDFLWAMKKANHGGVVHLLAGKTYVIGKKLDLSFLDDIYVRLDGEIKFTDDIPYWQSNNFYYPFQKSITFWVWGGRDIRIFGSGVINGNGQAWYDGFAGSEILDPDNTYYRPILFLTDNATRVDVQGIRFLNSPCWTNFIVRSRDVTFDGVTIEAYSTNASSLPKNTDGFDSMNTEFLSVLNTYVDVGDDCFSPKPNTSHITVRNLTCIGTHGVSMGSIGQYPGVLDYISHAYLSNIKLLGGENGARLKAWAGPNKGYGYITNITYEDIEVRDIDSPVVLDQCYFGVDEETCREWPSRVNISDVRFVNVWGTSSGKEGRVVVDLRCSPGAECERIWFEGLEVVSPVGEAVVVCDGVKGDIGVECVPSSEVEAS